MARRRIIEEPVNHERWLVSYADFITLLFAFFVVMYSISQVNEGKYKVLSETLTEVFSNEELAVERNLDPFQVGEIAKSNPRNFIELEESAIIKQDVDGEGKGEEFELGGLPQELKQLGERVDAAFGDLIEDNLITVRGNEEWLEVELKSSLLFSSGEARLNPDALGLLGQIADLLKDQPNPVRVEGFTDNVPINSRLFPSNWELSAARASAVVKLFTEEELSPARFAAIGYGEYQPIADNATPEGRARNRRVVLMISKTGELRPVLREIRSPEQFLEQAEEQAKLNTQQGIEIIIPGVDPAGGQENSATDENNIDGVKTIQLEDGGLLFTRDPPQ